MDNQSIKIKFLLKNDALVELTWSLLENGAWTCIASEEVLHDLNQVASDAISPRKSKVLEWMQTQSD